MRPTTDSPSQPPMEPALPPPWSWTSSLQGWREFPQELLSKSPVHGALLGHLCKYIPLSGCHGFQRLQAKEGPGKWLDGQRQTSD